MSKIDWRNHFVAFLSTLFGIFIAFQLESWRESRVERELVNVTLKSVKSEIEENILIYKKNIKQIEDQLEYIDFIINNSKEGILICTAEAYNRFSQKYPNRFEEVKFIKVLNDSLNEYSSFVVVDFLPITGISTSNWESAKTTGVLTLADQSQVSDITFIYEWISKDLGFTDADFFKYFLQREDKRFANLDEIIGNYRQLVAVYKYKLERIEPRMRAISW